MAAGEAMAAPHFQPATYYTMYRECIVLHNDSLAYTFGELFHSAGDFKSKQ